MPSALNISEEERTLQEIKAVILDLPPSDRDFVLSELALLEAKVAADPRQALVIALVGAKMAAGPTTDG